MIDLAAAKSELLRRKYRKDPFSVILGQQLLKIITKDSRLIKFNLNVIQRKLLLLIIKAYSSDKPARFIILKARQEGVSTLVEGVNYVLSAFKDNVKALIISKDADQASTLFEMFKLYDSELRRIDEMLVQKLKKSNAKEFLFEQSHSWIRIDTAKDVSAGRGDNYQIVHLSELAFYDYPDILMTGLSQAVADLPGTLMIIELSLIHI